VIDLHAHVLPAVDDGPETMLEAVEILRSMAADGTRVVCATPHVRDDFPTTAAEMEDGVARVRTAAAEAGVEIDVRRGGEVALDRLVRLDADERARFGLGGNPALLLLEFPYYGWPITLGMQCAGLLREGIVPVIAHPERNLEVQERPGRLSEAVEMGAFVQLTAASVDGRLGKRARACSRALLEEGLAHVVASDAHTAHVREAGLSPAADAVGDPGLWRWLVEDAPAALLAGERVAPAPTVVRRRRWLGR
jgi:protein-tyrosine phosphatase